VQNVEVEFLVIGDVSDAVIEALADLLIDSADDESSPNEV